ncbi:hypothetical protein F5887DRAFT_1073534 [Amanita rubescens]|nr:hypothetical protein F5887DRAFT_1073534 [Amanita rubescens]
MSNPSDPLSTLSSSIHSLAKYKKDILTYVHKATALPLDRGRYLVDLRTQTMPGEFEHHVEPILDVYQKMRDHCIHYENETHPIIVDSVSSIAEYSSGAEGVYSEICSTIEEMERTSSQPGALDSLIDDNINEITGFISNSRDANDKLKDFRDETWLDFNAADRETKKLDAELSAIEGNITKESDSIEGARRVIDKPSNTLTQKFHSFFSQPAAWKQPKASRLKLDRLLEIKKNGDAMKIHLQKIRDLADSAEKAMEALIGAFEDVSKQLTEIKEIVHTDLRKAISIVVRFDESKILKRWKDVGELAREFMTDAYLPGENLGKDVCSTL